MAIPIKNCDCLNSVTQTPICWELSQGGNELRRRKYLRGKKKKTSEFENTIGSPHSILQGLDIFFNVINVYD